MKESYSDFVKVSDVHIWSIVVPTDRLLSVQAV